jgi:hypothetical protein
VVQVRKALPKKKTRGNTGEVIKVRTPAKLVMEAPPRLQGRGEIKLAPRSSNPD